MSASFQGHDISVADFPSLVELMEKLAPTIAASELSWIREIASDLKELLTDREGPLAEAASLRRRIEKQEYEATVKRQAARVKTQGNP